MPTCPGVKKNKTRRARVAIDGVQVHTRDGGGRTWAKIHPQHTLTITIKIVNLKIRCSICLVFLISGWNRFLEMDWCRRRKWMKKKE